MGNLLLFVILKKTPTCEFRKITAALYRFSECVFNQLLWQRQHCFCVGGTTTHTRSCRQTLNCIWGEVTQYTLQLCILCNTGAIQEGAGLSPAGPLDPPCGQLAQGQHRWLSLGSAAALLLPSAAATEW